MNISSDLSSLQPTDLDAGQVFSGKPSGTTIGDIDVDALLARCERTGAPSERVWVSPVN